MRLRRTRMPGPDQRNIKTGVRRLPYPGFISLRQRHE